MASPPYITKQGMVQLDSELKQIWDRRRDVVKALSAAVGDSRMMLNISNNHYINGTYSDTISAHYL
ncbi:MAG: hypothetical protein COB23_04125 [Methylophaga sp.]|nr:MAG: hypothetical protein COB23_04125 [Methylophaga sp.]